MKILGGKTDTVFKNLKGEGGKIFVLSLLSVVVSLLCIARAKCYQVIIDAIGKADSPIVLYSCLFALLVVVTVILCQIYRFFRERTVTDMYNRIRHKVMNAAIGAEYGVISGFHTGDILNRMFSDAKIVSESTADIIPSLFELSVTLLGSAVFLFFISRPFCLILVASGILMSLVAVLARKVLKRLHKEVQESDGAVRSLFQEQLSGLLMIKVFGAEARSLSSIDKKQKNYFDKNMKKQIASCVLNFGYTMACNAVLLFTFFYAVYGIKEGFLTYGTLTAMMQLANNIQSSVTGLGALLPKIYSAAASGERVNEITDISKESEEKTELNEVSKIDFNNISFSYGRNDVLKNIGFSVSKGETVAIQGASGIGKSTLLYLLLGIYKCDSGEITISDGEKTEKAGKGTRRFFAFTPQGNGLFSGTIAENIIFARENVTDEEMKNALKISCADEFISALPDGVDTYLGENGAGLSEGQQQRIAIARALLSGAEVLLLDEATSALDEATEKRFIENLRTVGKTAILITHRKSPLSIASSSYIIKENGIEKVK